MQKRAGNFWDYVVQTHTIDLSTFELPGVKAVTFKFVDPIFEWVQRVNELHASGRKLIWDPQTLQHPRTGEECYGAGIQYGFLLRNAAARIPAGGKVALINLSWDGGSCGFGSRSATPMCVQVMNVNSASATAVGLVGYMPCIPVSESIRKTPNFKSASTHMMQVSLCTYIPLQSHVCYLHNIYVSK